MCSMPQYLVLNLSTQLKRFHMPRPLLLTSVPPQPHPTLP